LATIHAFESGVMIMIPVSAVSQYNGYYKEFETYHQSVAVMAIESPWLSETTAQVEAETVRLLQRLWVGVKTQHPALLFLLIGTLMNMAFLLSWFVA
jgi:Na+-transporting methylmalonyl-CoA/oxaloacetate decarboxylase beta subunit